MVKSRTHDIHGETSRVQSPDADLVRRARNGDEQACHDMVDRYGDYLYGLAYSLVGNAADSADVVQETFSGAFRRLRDFEERSSVKTWLSRILVRQAARHHRSRWRRRTVSLDSISGTSEESFTKGKANSAVTRSDTRMDVLAALQKLAPIHREVMVLRELEGMSYEEIGAVLGVPRGTVESRLFRARREMRERLRDYVS